MAYGIKGFRLEDKNEKSFNEVLVFAYLDPKSEDLDPRLGVEVKVDTGLLGKPDIRRGSYSMPLPDSPNAKDARAWIHQAIFRAVCNALGYSWNEYNYTANCTMDAFMDHFDEWVEEDDARPIWSSAGCALPPAEPVC